MKLNSRVVNEWNILDNEIISGRSLAGCKRKLDRHLRDKTGYIICSFSFLPLYRQWMSWIRWHIKFKFKSRKPGSQLAQADGQYSP